VIAIHVNTGELLNQDRSNSLKKSGWVLTAAGTAFTALYVWAKELPLVLGAVMVVGTAAILIVATEQSIKYYKAARRFYVDVLSKLDIKIKNRDVLLDGARRLTAMGRKIVESSGKHSEEYMLWKFVDSEPQSDYIFTREHVYAPVYDFGDHYVIILPPGREYYLKLHKNIELNAVPDKVIVHQDAGEAELEFQYVAGKSRNARLEFESHESKEIIAEANGIPFQKLIIRAGSTKDIVALVITKTGQKYKQDYSKYLEILGMLGGRYIAAFGKLIATLDYALAPDKHAEATAEFVRINGTEESTPSETPF